MVVVITGVAGAGKSTVGRALADALGWAFSDADDLHSAGNVARMARGEGLSDEQRWPWLTEVRKVIARAAAAGEHAVVACSALKEPYRRFLAEGAPSVAFVFLDADETLLRARLARRAGHFAGAALLESQLAAVERPADALALDAALPVATLVERIRAALGIEPAGRVNHESWPR
jgi:gluconokinase